jgi:hypothetical protein
VIKLFFAYQNVPIWLYKITAKSTQSKMGSFKFKRLCLVCIKNDKYEVRGVFTHGSVMEVKNSDGINIIAQSPSGGQGYVNFNDETLLQSIINAIFYKGGEK